MNTWIDTLLSCCALAAILFLIEAVERWKIVHSEINLGALPSVIKARQRMRHAYMLTLRHAHQEEGSWRKMVWDMSDKIRGAMAVSAHGSGDTDDAVAAYRRPHIQHPDMDEVERFMGHEDPIEYLRSSAGRCAPNPEVEDYSPLLTAEESRDSQRAPPPKSGTRAKPASDSVVPIRRRKVG